MKKITALLAIMIMVLTLSACVQTKSDIADYDRHVTEFHADLFMPGLDNIGEYETVRYTSKHDDGIFPWDSMQLIVQYDEDAFSKEKELLNTAYPYLEQPLKREETLDWLIPMAEFSAKGFDFRIAKFKDTEYPKNFGMVGISEEKHEVVYLWLYAPDLDLIAEGNENELKAMNEFLEYHFTLE